MDTYVCEVVLIESNLTDSYQYTMNWLNIPKYICWDIDGVNGNLFCKDNATIIKIIVIILPLNL